jgi:F-type H+-transporting ATPase subunit gamma
MAQTRDIKRRIKSIGNTKKITKAMELVSAAKMRKATNSVLNSRNYSHLAWELVKQLRERTDSKFHPLLQINPKTNGKIAVLLITSNRGFCGGFNSQIIQKTLQYFKQEESMGNEVTAIVLGKKGANFLAKNNFNLTAEFEKNNIAPDVEEIRPLAKLLINDFLNGKFTRVVVAYTDFISTLTQKPRIMELLPLSLLNEDPYLGRIKNLAPEESNANFEYLFEPKPDQVLEELLPRLLEMQIYQAVLEADASEYSARMVAMRNASEAATDMISGLTLAFNKARQGSITAELADISGGRAAVE